MKQKSPASHRQPGFFYSFTAMTLFLLLTATSLILSVFCFVRALQPNTSRRAIRAYVIVSILALIGAVANAFSAFRAWAI